MTNSQLPNPDFMMKHINLNYLDSLVEDDIETKTTMLNILLEETPDEISKIEQSHTAKDWTALKNAAHKLKSTLAFTGNQEMISANLEIEDIAKNASELEKLPSLIQKLVAVQPLVLEEVKLVLKELQQ